jgi:hypothetical protein
MLGQVSVFSRLDLSQLIYKPSVKGSAGEQILADIWPQYFSKDLIERLGGHLMLYKWVLSKTPKFMLILGTDIDIEWQYVIK